MVQAYIKVLLYMLPEGYQYKQSYTYPSELSQCIFYVDMCVYVHIKIYKKVFIVYK